MRLSSRILAFSALCLLLTGCVKVQPDPLLPPPPSETPEHDQPVFLHEAVNDDWFSGTAMIGHSLMRGMELYSGLDTPDYYTLSGGSVSQLLSSDQVTLPSGGKGRLADALARTSYRRFYLFMGINEIANELELLEADYRRLIELVSQNSPEASVYVLAVLPVTQGKAAGGTFTLERITAYNDMLQLLCEEYQCWYVDLYQCFADEDGYLPSSSSFDGVHLYREEYALLLDYLKTHTAD